MVCRGTRPPPRRSPYAWPHSRGGTARRPGRWQGRSGCRRRSNRQRRSVTSLRWGSLPGMVSLDRLERVACAGDAHGLVDIAAAGQRVTDGTADAGGRAAERLDLGGMVVGLVLEQQQPVLRLAVHIALDLDGAGVDLLALVQVLQDAALFQVPWRRWWPGPSGVQGLFLRPRAPRHAGP